MLDKQKIISNFLIAKGITTEQQLEHITQIQQRTQERIEDIFEKLGIVESVTELQHLIIQELGFSVETMDTSPLHADILSLVSPFIANRLRIVPCARVSEMLHLVIDSPLAFLSQDYFSQLLGMPIDAELISVKKMDELLKRYFPAAGEIAAPQEDAGSETLTEDDAPVVQLVGLLISDAQKKRASDIHVEPLADKLRIRYRIDGVLREVQSPDKHLQASIISRIKLMAGMNIAEKRLPQDGRIQTVVETKELDLRISTLPAHYGESVVMRILDRKVMTVEDLGFSLRQRDTFESVVSAPNGIILVTGPTGSGKSTTLYAVLSNIDRAKKKILTVEDPVEYQINGINQVQVKTTIGLSFARVLRAMLRQAPDIIMVGEIRDLETARISVQSALTGHLIFSTLHTNDASSAITRLVDMGIRPYLIAATLQAALAQRLVRVLCPECRQTYKPPKDELRILEMDDLPQDHVLYRAHGCSACAYTGYRGRTGIFELLLVDDEIRHLMHEQAPSTVIRDRARSKGMLTLKEHAREKVIEGVTTFQELVRVTQSDVD